MLLLCGRLGNPGQRRHTKRRLFRELDAFVSGRSEYSAASRHSRRLSQCQRERPAGSRRRNTGRNARFGDIFQILFGDRLQLRFQRRQQVLQRRAFGLDRIAYFYPE